MRIENEFARRIREARGIKQTPEQAAADAQIQGNQYESAAVERFKTQAGQMRDLFSSSIKTGFEQGGMAGMRSLLGGMLDRMMQSQADQWATKLTRGIFGQGSVEDAQGWSLGRGPAGGTPPFVPDGANMPFRSREAQQGESIASGIASALGGGGMLDNVVLNARNVVMTGGSAGAVAGGGAGSKPSLDQLFGMFGGME